MRLRVSHFFTPDAIRELDLAGMMMLTMQDQHCFVSPTLMVALKDSAFEYLVFTEGLTGFAGNTI